MRRRSVFLAALVTAAALVAASPAAAQTFGQIGTPWGEQGTGHGQFYNPGAFGVDSENGNVFTADFTADKSAFRIQELTDTGTFLGSVEIPHIVGGTNHTLLGIAVDAAAHRFYLVEACLVATGSTTCSANGKLAAINVLAFDTEPSGEALSRVGTFPLSAGETELYEPQAVSVDPGNGEVLILGEEAAAHKVVQRIAADGLLGGRFVDSANHLKPSLIGNASTLIVGPDGTAYMLSGGHPFAAGVALQIRGWELPRDMSAIKEIPGFAEAEAAEEWSNSLANPSIFAMRGPSLAISPGGQTLYWVETFVGTHQPALVRGFSLSGHETTVIYGAGKTTCKLESSVSPTYGPGIGTFGESVVAFEYGPEATKPTAKVAYGRKVYLFGPGGTGCPSAAVKPPVADFTIDGVEEGATAGEGETVEFDASSSQLHGGFREALIWKFGDGTETAVRCPDIGNGDCEEPAATTVTHKFSRPCTCKVELEMKLRNPRAGNPPVVSHSIEIEARPHFDLVVTKAGEGLGLVSSNWPGIYCGKLCEASFQVEKSVTLIPAAAPGSLFAGWGGAPECAGTTGLCRLTMTSAKAVTAAFVPAPPAPPAPAAPPAAASSSSVAVAAATTATTAKSPPKSEVPAACRKLKAKARARCIKKQAKNAKNKGKKAKRSSGKGQGSGKEVR
jgi:hypothetical protein